VAVSRETNRLTFLDLNEGLVREIWSLGTEFELCIRTLEELLPMAGLRMSRAGMEGCGVEVPLDLAWCSVPLL
jgi:hypothetical protein